MADGDKRQRRRREEWEKQGRGKVLVEESDMHHINGKRNRSSESRRETAVLNQILLCNGSTVCQFAERISPAPLPYFCPFIPDHLSSTRCHRPSLYFSALFSPCTCMHINTSLQQATQCAASQGVKMMHSGVIRSERSWRYVIFGSVTSDTAEMLDAKTGGGEESEKGEEGEAQRASALPHLQRSVINKPLHTSLT